MRDEILRIIFSFFLNNLHLSSCQLDVLTNISGLENWEPVETGLVAEVSSCHHSIELYGEISGPEEFRFNWSKNYFHPYIKNLNYSDSVNFSLIINNTSRSCQSVYPNWKQERIQFGEGRHRLRWILQFDSCHAGVTGKGFLRIINNPSTPQPPIISGPNKGFNNTNYSFSARTNHDDYGRIKYIFDWGDNSNSETEWLDSGTEGSCFHRWQNQGVYNVRARIRFENGVESNWSDTKRVPIDWQVDLPEGGDIQRVIDYLEKNATINLTGTTYQGGIRINCEKENLTIKSFVNANLKGLHNNYNVGFDNAKNINIEGLSLSGSYIGVQIERSNNCTIRYCSINFTLNNHNLGYGLYLNNSKNNDISFNNISSNDHTKYSIGISLCNSSYNRLIQNNFSMANNQLIRLYGNSCHNYIDINNLLRIDEIHGKIYDDGKIIDLSQPAIDEKSCQVWL